MQAIRGLKLEFIDQLPPIQYHPPHQIQFSPAEMADVDTEIGKLLKKGVLVESSHEIGEFICTIFTRPKKDGSRRMIFNLKPLNEYITYHKFKMDTLKTALTLVNKQCFMASLDIKDAYYMVRIHPDDRKYLKFHWRDKLFAYTALPMGYSASPRIFTKILKPIFATLRQKGVTVMGYIDDFYIQGDSAEQCQTAIKATTQLLESCGFIINYEKSSCIPKHEIKFLGFIINSESMTVKLPDDKTCEVVQLCEKFMTKDKAHIRDIARLIGKLVASFPAVPYGPLFYRSMETGKIDALACNNDNYNATMPITESMKTELAWWKENIGTSVNKIDKGNSEVTLETDATLQTWGAKCGVLKAGGYFKDSELKKCNNNINACEILAIGLALKAFANIVAGKIVLVRTDNTSAVSYISHMGGTRSHCCNSLAHEVWLWCIQNNTWLTAEFIPGVLNVDADWESRHINDRTEWSLNEDMFQKITRKFGTPEVDLFASRLNAKLPRFVSWKPEPGAEYTNAFSFSWSNIYGYCFPPFSLIARVVRKIKLDMADVLAIVPLWPNQAWFTPLMTLLIAHPVLLPWSKKLLNLPQRPHCIHPLQQRLKLVICKLSGKPSKQAKFQAGLSKLLTIPGGQAPENNMASILRNGKHFLVKDRLVTINLL